MSKNIEEMSKDEIISFIEKDNFGVKLFDCPDYLKDDEDVVMAAIKNNFFSIEYSSDRLKKDLTFILKTIPHVSFPDLFIKYIHDDIKNNKEVALACVSKSGRSYKSLSKEMKSDFDVVLKTVKQDGSVLEFVSDAFRDNDDICYAALNQNVFAYPFTSRRYQEKSETLDFVYQNGVLGFFQLKNSEHVSPFNVESKRFDDFLLKVKKPSEFYINEFNKFDVDYLKKNDITDQPALPIRQALVHILNKIDNKDLEQLESFHFLTTELINRQKILNVKSESKPKNKSRKINF